MDRTFANLVTNMDLTVSDAARVCATTPAEALGLERVGGIVEGWAADLVLMDGDLRVVATVIAGEMAWSCGRPGF
jgi:N-acetylglucosamine-6-phosphate deacetylase